MKMVNGCSNSVLILISTILSVYAPTLCSTPEAKDIVYEELEATIRQTPSEENIFLLGDFNALPRQIQGLRVLCEESGWTDLGQHEALDINGKVAVTDGSMVPGKTRETVTR